MKFTRRGLMGSALAASMVGRAAAEPVVGRDRAADGKPLVIGHRGAPALRPEHTLASYAKAIADGADFVEPDLVPTKDGVLVARHESNIADTTDVAGRPEFAARRTTRTIDGKTQTGWFTVDFTLAELKTLRAKERLPKIRPQNTVYDGQFQIPTFEEIIDFVAAESATRGRPIGLIPELKSVRDFRALGLPTEQRFVDVISAHSYTQTAPVELQCFYAEGLRHVRDILGHSRRNLRFMQLMGEAHDITIPGQQGTFGEMMTPAGLREVASYADIIGPSTRSVIPLGPDQRLAAPTALVSDAHAAGLAVHVYTFRPENVFLAADFRNDSGPAARNPEGSIAEIRRYLATGIDGFFTDDPALGRAALA